MSNSHFWEIDADCPDPMGKIYNYARCRKCNFKVDIKYMDILPWESIERLNILQAVPLDQFDMTMALMNQSNCLTMTDNMRLLWCPI